MNAQELTLNIALNLGRIARFAAEKKEKRVAQFFQDNELYISQLKEIKKNGSFTKTFEKFVEEINLLHQNSDHSEAWIEALYTWAAILTHRAKSVASS